MNISVGSVNVLTLFVTIRDEILIPASGSMFRIGNNVTTITTFVSFCSCYDSFVDINDMFYCSYPDSHRVLRKSLDSSLNSYSIIAGGGYCGSTADLLCNPYGIFVDINLDLYVADYSYSRIQRFHQGQLNATTVAGGAVSATTISLYYPAAVILDADKYLYIVDYWNHRIVGQGPNGFRCIVGCNGGGSASDQLAYPMSLSFDSYGNLFVVDRDNNRIQKFVLASNSCSKSCKSRVTTIE